MHSPIKNNSNSSHKVSNIAEPHYCAVGTLHVQRLCLLLCTNDLHTVSNMTATFIFSSNGIGLTSLQSLVRFLWDKQFPFPHIHVCKKPVCTSIYLMLHTSLWQEEYLAGLPSQGVFKITEEKATLRHVATTVCCMVHTLQTDKEGGTPLLRKMLFDLV